MKWREKRENSRTAEPQISTMLRDKAVASWTGILLGFSVRHLVPLFWRVRDTPYKHRTHWILSWCMHLKNAFATFFSVIVLLGKYPVRTGIYPRVFEQDAANGLLPNEKISQTNTAKLHTSDLRVKKSFLRYSKAIHFHGTNILEAFLYFFSS